MPEVAFATPAVTMTPHATAAVQIQDAMVNSPSRFRATISGVMDT